MKQIDEKTVAAMVAAQDAAAQSFWAYPDAEWQTAFQAEWLEAAVGVDQATGPDGLLWGREEPRCQPAARADRLTTRWLELPRDGRNGRNGVVVGGLARLFREVAIAGPRHRLPR